MAGKPTYNELEREIKQLEKEFLEYVRKAKELDKKRKVTEHSHIRRTISLMHINEELYREIKKLKRSSTEELEMAAHKLRERIKELNCLYDISFFEKKFKPIGACSGYKIASSFLAGHFIPAPFFNKFSSLP